MAAKDFTLSADKLRESLHYNPTTGDFVWRRMPGDSRRSRFQNRKLAGKVAGKKNEKGYIWIYVDGVRYRAHRLAILYMTGKPAEGVVDHINGDPADNRYFNLRVCRQDQNAWNAKKPKTNTTGIKGVHLHRPSGKYIARVRYKGERLYLGSFSDPDEAMKTIVRWRATLHKEFARDE